MKDNAQVSEFDPEAVGRNHAQEVISLLAQECHTPEAFIEAYTKLRRALLEALDAADPAQVIEAAQRDAMPEEISRRLADESEQRRKDRGSLQDPLYPPERSNRWD